MLRRPSVIARTMSPDAHQRQAESFPAMSAPMEICGSDGGEALSLISISPTQARVCAARSGKSCTFWMALRKQVSKEGYLFVPPQPKEVPSGGGAVIPSRFGALSAATKAPE